MRLGSRSWWPHYVYHFTDVQNAAQVIQSGYLCSRIEATRLGLMKVDNASPEIIRQTQPEHRKFARLYFRPRTPTQYRNEGIRPVAKRELGGAHCPIPVFFCFDALTVLGLDDTEFSDGNMGSRGACHSRSRDFFFAIPFESVFHDRPLPAISDQKREIIFRRHAEVLVPRQLPLENTLKFVACRSVAERQTLLSLLPYKLRRQWASRIRLGEQGLFFNYWTFVEEVVVVDDIVEFRFNPNSQTPGPFLAKFSYFENGRGAERSWQSSVDSLRDHVLRIRIPSAVKGIAQLYLDDALAFYGWITFEEIPF